MRIRTRATAAVFGAALMLVGLSAPAGAGPVNQGSNEQLVFSFTSATATGFSGEATAIGVVNGRGSVTAGEGEVFPAVVKLPQGKLKLRVTSGPGNETPNFATCAFVFDGTDTIKVTGGTGVFAGATGSGSDTANGVFVFAKNGDGTCNFGAGPTRVVIIVRASLSLHLAA